MRTPEKVSPGSKPSEPVARLFSKTLLQMRLSTCSAPAGAAVAGAVVAEGGVGHVQVLGTGHAGRAAGDVGPISGPRLPLKVTP
jgi:hypothetical protein